MVRLLGENVIIAGTIREPGEGLDLERRLKEITGLGWGTSNYLPLVRCARHARRHRVKLDDPGNAFESPQGLGVAHAGPVRDQPDNVIVIAVVVDSKDPGRIRWVGTGEDDEKRYGRNQASRKEPATDPPVARSSQ